MRTPFLISLLILLSLLFAGCAKPMAQLPGVRPAQIGLPGVDTLAVADFEVLGAGYHDQMVADQARQCLLRELLASNRYQVLDGQGRTTTGDAARSDALIRAQVTSSLHDRQLNELAHIQDKATKTTTITHPDGSTSTREETVTLERTEQAPGVHRQARVRVVLTVLDPRTAALIGSGGKTVHFDKTYGGAAALAGSDEYDSDRPALYQLQSADRTLGEMACQAGTSLGRDLSPQSYVLSVDLDSGLGDGPAEQGAWMADAGDWEGAVRVWSAIPPGHPEYGPALYNLGLYWEFRGGPADFLQAREYYTQAMAVVDQPLYREALERIDMRLDEVRQLSLQSGTEYILQ